MKFSNFDHPIFEYIRNKTFMIFAALNVPVLSSNQMFGLSSSSVIINFMDKIIVIFLIILFASLFLLLSYWWRNKDNKFAKFIKKKDIELRYEGVTRFYIEIVLNLSFVSFINLVYGKYYDPFDLVSYIFASSFSSFFILYDSLLIYLSN